MIQHIQSDDDVQFYWEIASADFKIDDTETKDLLLTKIVQLYFSQFEDIRLQKLQWKDINNSLKAHNLQKVCIRIYMTRQNRFLIKFLLIQHCKYLNNFTKKFYLKLLVQLIF